MSENNLSNRDNNEYWSSDYNQYSYRTNGTMWDVYDKFSKDPIAKSISWIDKLFGINPVNLFRTDVIAIRLTKNQAKEIAFLLNGDRHLCKEMMLLKED